MDITWWGTAGFCIETGRNIFLIDPYLSRNGSSRPEQSLNPHDITAGKQIFISHGHFDHIYDVPGIASRTGSLVYCSEVAAKTLVEQGLAREQIKIVIADGDNFDFEGYRAEAFYSEHVKFDKWLILKTLARIHFRLFQYMPLTKDYPKGQVLSWRFTIDGRTIHHFGSGGSSPEELERLGRNPTDILLVPLQGHTRICDIAVKYVQALRPRMVIPHHQDDFFPPISTMVDIKPFIKGVAQTCPETEVRVIEMNETITF